MLVNRIADPVNPWVTLTERQRERQRSIRESENGAEEVSSGGGESEGS